ncbi:MAG: PP2C family protein-serine/threonine phosphatase [Terracidiphilus sp.]
MRRVPHVLLCFALLFVLGRGSAPAQTAASTAGPVRYHFGDDPNGAKGWANPNTDDSSWPVAQQGRWPEPVFDSDGFVWVRMLVPVRSDTAEPLALRIVDLSRAWMANEVFVNGVRVGSFGRLPPDLFVPGFPLDAVFDLPSGLTHPGAVAHVALRIWYPPFARVPSGREADQPVGAAPPSAGPTAIEAMKKQPGGFDAVSLTFDQSRTLHAEEATASEQARLRNVLPITLNILILLIGIVILLLARSSRSLDLYLYGAMLATFPWVTLFFEFVDARFANLSEPQTAVLQVLSQLPSMIVTIEFIWRINGFHDVWFKRLTYAAMALFNIGVLVAFIPVNPSEFVGFSLVGYRVALQAFNILTIFANLWVIFVKRQRRLIAFAMVLVPSASLAEGFRNTSQSADLFDLAFFLSGFCLTAILAHQAWKEWRSRDALQAEFEAARELQQRLISPAVDLPGFRIESAYKPALHVGGDFFYVRPEDDGSILVVIGDVSGKGLRAAMTVNSVIGALRTMPSLAPARILTALNRGLAGQMQGGFVTCCAARVGTGGALAIANAGHLPPYHNGAEIPVTAGLPLGIDPSVEYEENHLALPAEGSLTFLSDGVVEAQSPTGELFGFDRTRAISTRSAEQIAAAAQAHGQQDDITVLTLTFAPAEVLHA